MALLVFALPDVVLREALNARVDTSTDSDHVDCLGPFSCNVRLLGLSFKVVSLCLFLWRSPFHLLFVLFSPLIA